MSSQSMLGSRKPSGKGHFRVPKTLTFKPTCLSSNSQFLVKMSFICMRIKNHFPINGFALSLGFKQRLERGSSDMA